MSPQTAPAPLPIVAVPGAPQRSTGWLRAARQARWLAWASLFWMTLEGVLGVLAGV